MYRILFLLPLLGCDLPTGVESSPCDLGFLPDSDEDGFPGLGDLLNACEAPTGYVSVNLPTDCDDTDPSISPVADEHCDGLDENCNNVPDDDPVDGFSYYVDLDADGYGDIVSVVRTCVESDSPGYMSVGGDCDDTNPDINPLAEEICNGVDDDCNGIYDDGMQTGTFWLDLDGDGYGSPELPEEVGEAPGPASIDACIAPVWYASHDGDCAPKDPSVNPSALELCNGVDDDCDGTVADETSDEDGDGYTVCSGDCDDSSSSANPDGVEVCDEVDNDCDGVTNWADDFEDNNTRDAAPLVATNDEVVTLTGMISGPDDRSDWFAMDTIDDPDNLFNGDSFYASFTVTDLPPGVEASLHMYRWADVAAGNVRHVMVDNTWEDGILHVEREGVWLSNDGNRYWAHLEIHEGYDCDASYTLELSNGG